MIPTFFAHLVRTSASRWRRSPPPSLSAPRGRICCRAAARARTDAFWSRCAPRRSQYCRPYLNVAVSRPRLPAGAPRADRLGTAADRDHTELGLRAAAPAALDAARGMGMTARQIRNRVEWPLAVPFLFAGFRTAAIEVVASATLASFIGGGGLGDFIVDGLATTTWATLSRRDLGRAPRPRARCRARTLGRRIRPKGLA